MTEMHNVYLALGTNLGHREENLRQALQKLSAQVKHLVVSRLYETEPAYVQDQPAFLNIAVGGQTELSPQDLLTFLKQIENEIGREKTIRYGPRLIDLDILLYEDVVLDTADLQIPHPRMAERGFVLLPLADIAPSIIHPILNKTMLEFVELLPEEDGIIKVVDWQ